MSFVRYMQLLAARREGCYIFYGFKSLRRLVFSSLLSPSVLVSRRRGSGGGGEVESTDVLKPAARFFVLKRFCRDMIPTTWQVGGGMRSRQNVHLLLGMLHWVDCSLGLVCAWFGISE